MRFTAEHWVTLLVIAMMATSCGGCGIAAITSYSFARAEAYGHCVAHHAPDDCGGALW